MIYNEKRTIMEAYDARVAFPLIIVALLSLIFVDASGHKTVNFRNSAGLSAHHQIVSKEKAPAVNPASNLPTLNKTVQSQDLSPGQTPLDIQTASPQTSRANGSASTGSAERLQNTPDNPPMNSNQPSTSATENIINGTTGTLINTSKSSASH